MFYKTFVCQCSTQTCSKRHKSISALCRHVLQDIRLSVQYADMYYKTFVYQCIMHNVPQDVSLSVHRADMFYKTCVPQCVMQTCSTIPSSVSALCRMSHNTFVCQCIMQNEPQDLRLSVHCAECATRRKSISASCRHVLQDMRPSVRYADMFYKTCVCLCSMQNTPQNVRP